LATRPLGAFIVHYVVLATVELTKKKTKSLAQPVEKLWRAGSRNLKSRSRNPGNAQFGAIHHSSSPCVVHATADLTKKRSVSLLLFKVMTGVPKFKK